MKLIVKKIVDYRRVRIKRGFKHVIYYHWCLVHHHLISPIQVSLREYQGNSAFIPCLLEHSSPSPDYAVFSYYYNGIQYNKRIGFVAQNVDLSPSSVAQNTSRLDCTQCWRQFVGTLLRNSSRKRGTRRGVHPARPPLPRFHPHTDNPAFPSGLVQTL